MHFRIVCVLFSSILARNRISNFSTMPKAGTITSFFKRSSADANNSNDGPSNMKRTKAEDTVVGSNNSASVMNSSAVTVDDNFKKSAEKRVNEENSVAAISTTVVTENDVLSWEPVQTLESGWKQKLSKEFQKTYFKNLHKFVHSEYSSKTVFPPKNLILSALNLCSYDKVKVVIVGQDPYHGPRQAHGLAFSVPVGVPLPPSLKNMMTELRNDDKVTFSLPSHGNLECWSTQGVLLLNTCLTVRQGEANSHQKKGWEEFTDAIIKVLSEKEGLVYLLWGKPALTKCKGINAIKNTIITSSHPSPLSAYSTSTPFIGSKCFSRCNEDLVARNLEPIDWSIK